MLTARNSDALISIVATELTLRLERAIKKSTFNRVSYVFISQFIKLIAFDSTPFTVGWFSIGPRSTCFGCLLGRCNIMVYT